MSLIQGTYSATLPTLSDNQNDTVQVDNRGRLLAVTGAAASSTQRIYTATLAAGVVYQLTSPTGSAKNPSGVTALPIIASGCTQGLTARNTGSNDLAFLSAATDTAAAGFPIKANEVSAVPVKDGSALWVVSTLGTSIAVWEV
jgi:hypothetical protein